MDITTLLLAGAAAGTAAGLLGIGGGTIIVPVLVLVFVAEGVHPDILIKVAIGTSLATIVVTAISSIWMHHRKGAVRWPLVKVMTPGVIIGSLLGAALADIIPAMWLSIAFIIFVCGVSVQMAIGTVQGKHGLPSVWGLRAVSMVVGVISALMGIGGGALHVPYFSWCGVPVKHSIATAAAIGLPLAVASSAGFIIAGMNEANLPPHSLGYVNLPAFGGIVTASIIFAPLGAKLAHMLPDIVLKRFFAIFLFILAMRMTYDLFFSSPG
ncbi:MAG: sulfite exporter TauE/SafE family protein [Gammaproteobacteria bacterium]|nr:MAG: sulfite exporter TauE/SafE family protein [Gammaproteobacteria bacterium]